MSQAATSPVELSAMRYALTCSSVRLSATTTGTSFSLSCLAALYRVCPTMMVPCLSTTMGCCQPNSFMLFATGLTAAALFRGLLWYGCTSSIFQVCTCIGFPPFCVFSLYRIMVLAGKTGRVFHRAVRVQKWQLFGTEAEKLPGI